MEKPIKLSNGLVIIWNDRGNCYDIWTTSAEPLTFYAPYPVDVQMMIGARLETCLNSMDSRQKAIEWATPLDKAQLDTLEYVSEIKDLLSIMSEASRKLTKLTKEYVNKGYCKSFDDVYIPNSLGGRSLRSWLEDPVFGAAAVEDMLDGVGMTKGSKDYRLSRTRAVNKAFGYNSQV